MKKTKKAQCKIDISFEESCEIDISVKEILDNAKFNEEYEIKDIKIEKDKKDKKIKFLLKLKEKKPKDKELIKYIKK